MSSCVSLHSAKRQGAPVGGLWTPVNCTHTLTFEVVTMFIEQHLHKVLSFSFVLIHWYKEKSRQNCTFCFVFAKLFVSVSRHSGIVVYTLMITFIIHYKFLKIVEKKDTCKIKV